MVFPSLRSALGKRAEGKRADNSAAMDCAVIKLMKIGEDSLFIEGTVQPAVIPFMHLFYRAESCVI